MQQTLKKNTLELIKILDSVHEYNPILETYAQLLVNCFRNNGKVILAGNGGSCADCQHIAGEFVGRFMIERPTLPAMSLTADTAVLTCIGNDYGFDELFSRQINGLYKEYDVVWMLSTSGESKNLIKLAEVCKMNNFRTISFLGKTGGGLGKIIENPLIIKNTSTARIQEVHMLLAHSLIEKVEAELFDA